MLNFILWVCALLFYNVIAETSTRIIEPPKLQPLTFPRNPTLNKKLVLSCVAMEGDPPLEFAWTKDGLTEREGERYSTAVLTSHISSLTIPELTAQDVGNYTCHVSNAAGTDSSTASLLVHGITSTSSAKANKALILLVAFPGGANGTLGGRHHFQRLAVSPRTSHAAPLVPGRLRQAGAYASSARHCRSHSSTPDSVHVLHGVFVVPHSRSWSFGSLYWRLSSSTPAAQSLPKFCRSAFPREHRIGDAVAATCVASRGSQPLAFAWLKNGSPVMAGSKAAPKMLTESISALTMSSVDADDIGELHVPRHQRRRKRQLHGRTGRHCPLLKKKVVVSCVAVEGDAPLRFAWSKDGGAEGERKRYTVDTLSSHLSSLTIPEVTAQDIGNYTCRVANAAGTDTFTASLLVQGSVLKSQAVLAQITLPRLKVKATVATLSFILIDNSQRLIGNSISFPQSLFPPESKDAPKLQPFYFPKENQLLQTIVVSCIAVRGSQPLEFSWSKDGLPLAHKDKRVATRLLTDTISTLTVTNVRAENIGNYTCRASNAGGFDSITAEVIVTGEEYH
ncbi:hypothetical protein MRX96_041923 [Rhipicephalus microplus]